jgi:hypothetical protein
MNNSNNTQNFVKNEPKQFIEGRDYYFENGLMVLTADFLSQRGYCCQNSCRHCPYQNETADLQEKSL